MSYPLRVSLDGGATWQYAPNGVRAIYSGIELEDGRKAELALNIAAEGLITDLWAEPIVGEGRLDHLEATDSQTVDDLVAKLG